MNLQIITGEFPEEIHEVKVPFMEAIQDFMSVYSFEDWDNNNAKAIPNESILRLITFTKKLIFEIKTKTGVTCLPEMSACADGSIDLSWHNDAQNFLINVDQKNFSYFGYIGDNIYARENEINGTGSIHEPNFDAIVSLFSPNNRA